jgi:predicted transcriptional regulator
MEIAKASALSYKAVLHHLRLLEGENIASHTTGKKPYLWEPTGAGQQRLKSV